MKSKVTSCTGQLQIHCQYLLEGQPTLSIQTGVGMNLCRSYPIPINYFISGIIVCLQFVIWDFCL